MSIYELDICWATTANERRRLHWAPFVSTEVGGVSLTPREDLLAVPCDGDRRGFEACARRLEPNEGRTKPQAHDSHPITATTNREGAL